MLLRVFRAIFGVRAGDEVDDLLLGWRGGSPDAWEAWASAPSQFRSTP